MCMRNLERSTSSSKGRINLGTMPEFVLHFLKQYRGMNFAKIILFLRQRLFMRSTDILLWLGLNDNDAGYALSMMQDARKRLGIPADQKLSIVYAVYEGDVLKKQAEILKKAWEPLGVELTVQTTRFERYNGSIPGWNADLFSYTWLGDFADPLAMLELFRGGSSLNITLYNSERYNNLLDKAANASDSAEHNKYLSQAEQCLLDDAEIIPVSHPVSFHAIDMNSIGGWTANALDYHPLKYLYIKHRETTVPNLVLAK